MRSRLQQAICRVNTAAGFCFAQYVCYRNGQLTVDTLALAYVSGLHHQFYQASSSSIEVGVRRSTRLVAAVYLRDGLAARMAHEYERYKLLPRTKHTSRPAADVRRPWTDGRDVNDKISYGTLHMLHSHVAKYLAYELHTMHVHLSSVGWN